MVSSRVKTAGGLTLIAVTVAVGLWFVVSPEGREIARSSSVARQELTTSIPTMSSMPSQAPSVSSAPTLRPSSVPSSIPSHSPSSEPSLAPSSIPTQIPTKAPTASPAPSTTPSSSPTDAPSAPPIPNKYKFRMKLYWKKGYTWQDETFEREWCLECTKCAQLTTSGNGEGCVRRSGCARGDQLWLARCTRKGNNARFEIMSRDDKKGDLFKIVSENLCVERKESRYVALEKCDRNERRQRWINFRAREQPFAWMPADTAGCMSQHHHPKAKEVIYIESCDLAHRYNTGFWEAYPV